jgi:tRNA nucleotidyltransferase (CCA-adding enzyme)
MSEKGIQVITTHTGADFDAMASMLAASKIYPDALLFLPGSPEKQVREYLDNEGFPGELTDFKEIKNKKIELLVIVDTCYKSRIGRLQDIIAAETEIHVYDHHPETEKDIRGQINVRNKHGANTTVLVQKIIEKKIELTPAEATLMAMGIYEDTGCFTYSITTPEDLEAVEYLLTKGASLKIISKYVIHELTEEQVYLLDSLLMSKEFIEKNNARIAFTYAERDEYIEELSVVVHKVMDIIKPDTLFSLIKIKSKIICIARSRSKKIDVGKTLSDFGGGGHPTAASASFEGLSVQQAKDKIIDIINRAAAVKSKEKTITKTAKIIPASHDAEKVYHTLNHLNLKFAPVGGSDGTIAGIVQREELDKAVRHGFGDHPVTEFITRRVPEVDEDEKPSRIEKKMAESGYPFLVLKKKSGRIAGIIENKRKTEISGEGTEIEPLYEKIITKLENNISKEVLNIIKTASRIASELGVEAYCVGGMVRDILMDIIHQDIDIVVEKKGIELAKRLAEELGGHASIHEKFKTAVIKLPEREIDVATLRKEYYEFPAALPTVAEGTLVQDLYRRDFTINAMAIQISPEKDYGKLIDYFEGKKDLDNKNVSILYPLSFIEDPTRIFRAVRFEKRFNFKLSEETLKQLNKTVHMDIHSNLTTDRVREEIILILKEKNSYDMLLRLSELGVLSCIHSGLKINEATYNSLKEYSGVLSGMPRAIRKIWKDKEWEVVLMMLIANLDVEAGKRVLKEFKFPDKVVLNYLSVKKYANRIIALLSKDISNARLYKALHNISLEVLFYVLTVSHNDIVNDKVREYFTVLKDIKPEMNGNDLEKMGYDPSPFYTRILFRLKIAKLNGTVANRQEERNYLLENFPID